MALPQDDQEWVNHLARRHDAELADLRQYNDLYEGEAPLAYLHPEIQREVGDRLKAVSLGWPMLAVDTVEERLDVLGFRYPEDDAGDADPEELASLAGDKELQRVWQDNDLDEESQLGHVDALVMRRAYIAVGTNEDDPDTPLVTVESPLELYADIDPRTRMTRAALRRWADPASDVRVRERHATLYLPNRTVYTTWNGRWQVDDVDAHGLGVPPIVPLTNRARLSDRYGRSELTPQLLSIADAANKIATDMMVGAEFHAIPLRAIFGIGPEDLEDEAGNRLSALQVVMGRLLTIPADNGNEIKAHEFAASALSNFHDTLNQLAKHVAGLLGLPPHSLGFTTDNPASADAIRSAEARLVKRAERKQRAFGGPWEKAMRLVKRFQDGDWDPATKRLETIWRDASTPTRAQAADAAVKLFTATNGPIVPLRQTREDLGYGPGQIRRMEAEDEKRRAEDPVADIARGLAGGMPSPNGREPVNAGIGA